MQLLHGLNLPTIVRPKANSQKPLRDSAKPADRNKSQQAVEEINAYIAIRDMYLAEAEASTTDATLKRACMANDFVETCLKPARSPYKAQHLPEADAIRERKRCEAVKVRIAELACVVTARGDHATAA